MSSTKKNFFYSVGYHILTMILPLITAPYIARVLKPEAAGIYSYTYSIVYYFTLVAKLGMRNYANRTIARVRDNKEELNKTFWELYIMQFIVTILTILAYIIYLIFIENTNKIVSSIQLILLSSVLFDISWFYFGMEKFKTTVTRDCAVKVLTVACILIFVKKESDLGLYTFIMTFSTLISQLVLWKFIKKYISFVKVSWKGICKHFKPNLILFLPTIAVSVYTMMDKIILGNMTNMNQVGYYEYAERVINIPTGIITALGTVMLPKMSNLVATGDIQKTKEYIAKSIKFVMFLSCALMFGIAGISSKFAPFFLGEDFTESGILIYVLSFTIVFISWANVIRTQYLIPNMRDKQYTISLILGALVNLVLNIFLINKFEAVGAAIATVFAEATVCIYQTIYVRKELPIIKYIKDSAFFLIAGLVMYLIVRQIGNLGGANIITIFMQVAVGATVYLTVSIAYYWKTDKELVKGLLKK